MDAGVNIVAGIHSQGSLPETGSGHQFQCDVGNEVQHPDECLVMSVEIVNILILLTSGKTRMD